MQRTSGWLITLLALAVFAAAGYVIADNDPVRHAGRTLPLPTVPASPSNAARETPAGRRPVVAFLGDDWTAGAGASDPAHRFTTVLSSALDLSQRNFGAAGTGYSKASDTAGAYKSRVAAVAASHPDVVVVSGGRNDVTNSLDTTRSDVRELFTALRRQLPDAELIAVAPLWGDSDQPNTLTRIGTAVQAAVTGVGGHYIAISDPIHGHPSYMADDADPDDAGYAAVAAAVQPKLAALLP